MCQRIRFADGDGQYVAVVFIRLVGIDVVGILCPCGAVELGIASRHDDAEVPGQVAEGILSQFGRQGADDADGVEFRAAGKGIGTDIFDRGRQRDAFQVASPAEGLFKPLHILEIVEVVEVGYAAVVEVALHALANQIFRGEELALGSQQFHDGIVVEGSKDGLCMLGQGHVVHVVANRGREGIDLLQCSAPGVTGAGGGMLVGQQHQFQHRAVEHVRAICPTVIVLHGSGDGHTLQCRAAFEDAGGDGGEALRQDDRFEGSATFEEVTGQHVVLFDALP